MSAIRLPFSSLLLQAGKSASCGLIGLWVWMCSSPLIAAERINLPNGNYVIVDPTYDLLGPVPLSDVGAVYHYQGGGPGQLLGMVTGSTSNDQVGSGGVVPFGSSGFVILSPQWDNGATTDAGAVTMGIPSGAISAANSLVGSSTGDQVGSGGVTVFGSAPSLGFVVISPLWDNGATTDAGAVTTIGGTSGTVSGVVSTANSLVGTSTGDQVGNGGVTVYYAEPVPSFVVLSPLWDNGAATNAGAVTTIGGSSGAFSGTVSTANSLVGSSIGDQVGSGGLTVINTGPIPGFVVISPLWDNGAATNAGAVTAGAPTGAVSAANSLVGSSTGDQIGSGGVTLFSVGPGFQSFVILSPLWDNGIATDAGAVTAGAPPGAVSAANSLVGSSTGDQIGSGGVTLFNTGPVTRSFVILSPLWDNGAATDAGAVTFGAPQGAVSAANSLVGSSTGDQIGSGGVTLFANGLAPGTQNVLILSPLWDNGAATDAGAITAGAPGVPPGAVSAANSLVGSSTGDQIGSGGVTLFSTGPGSQSFVILSPLWDNGAATDAGAITVGAPPGAVSAANSLVGSSAGDQIGSGGVTLFSILPGYQSFVILSPQWDNGAATDAGAATFGAPPGAVSAANSFVGSSTGDQIGSGGVTLIANGLGPGTQSYVLLSPLWDNGAATDAGAVTTFGAPPGVVSAANSLVGSSTGDQIGSGGVTLFSTGPGQSFVIRSPLWDNGSATDAGAVTVGAPPGVVSAANSMVGSSTGDQIGSGGVTFFGPVFLILSPLWDNGSATDAGAITKGVASGAISAANSLVGSSTGDQIGSGGITTFGSGLDARVLILSPLWDNGTATDAGAVTMNDVYTPLLGSISAANSLVGSSTGDQVSSGGVTLFGSGAGTGFVIASPLWDNGAAMDAGAVTMGGPPSFFPPLVGAVSAANSLVGSSTGDQVGSGGIQLRPNSTNTTSSNNFILVMSPLWDNGAATNAGAVTMTSSSGTFPPRVGAVSAANSLVGSSPGDQVGSGGIKLWGFSQTYGPPLTENIFCVIHSPLWDNGPAVDAGALTLGGSLPGMNPFQGVLSAANSLVGSHSNDQIGSGGIQTVIHPILQVLTDINFLSPNWCYGAGAISPLPFNQNTWNGVVSAANSTVGAESEEPEIVLLQPTPTEVASGGGRDFGGVAENNTISLTFDIKNNGTDDLLLSGIPKVTLTGPDAALFSIVTQPPALIVAGDSASMTVNFTPTGSGQKTAQLSIASNDGNEGTYLINLTGTVLLPVSNWRQTYFGSPANDGMGADNGDFDHDGIPNILEYAFNLNPAQNTAGQLPLPALGGGNYGMSFQQPAHVSGIIYGAEWSTSLSPTGWLPVPDTGTPPQHVFSVPVSGNTQIFMRLKVVPVP